jgi:outer membrane protein
VGRRLRFAAAICALAAAAPASAQDPVPKGEDPPPPAKAAPRVLRMSLREAVATAMRSNLDLQAASYAPPVAAAAVRSEEALYDHLFTARVSGGQRRAPVPSTSLGDGTEIAEDTFSASIGIQRLLPTGGTIGIRTGLDRTLTNSTFYEINPYWESDLTLRFTQPLLRNAGRDVTEANLRFIRDSKDLADLDLRGRTEDLVRLVEATYWGLVQARQDVQSQMKSVEVSEDLLRITEARLEAGAGTRVDVSQAAAGVALRKVDLLRAENTLRTFEENLLGFLMPRTPDSPSGGDLRFEPADDPEASLPPLPLEDVDAAVSRALKDRADVRSLRVQVDQAQVTVLIAESNVKPLLNLEATAGYSGVDGHADTSYTHSMAKREWPSWSVGLFLDVPIGNREAKARLEGAVLARSRAEAEVRAAESRAAVRVRNTRREIDSTRKQIDASRLATRLSEEQLAAEKERLRNDKSTTFEVLRLESDLTDARRSEIRALVDYLQACIRYEFELGRILESRGLVPPGVEK